MGGDQRLQEPSDDLLGGACPLDLGVQLLRRLVRLRVAGLVDRLAAGDLRLDDLPVLAHVAQAASGELVRVAVEDQQREQLRDRRGDLRCVVAELELAAELEVRCGRRLLRLGPLLALLPPLLLLGVDRLRGRVVVLAGGGSLALLQLAFVAVELEPDAVGDERRVGDERARPVVAVLELEQAAVAAGGVGVGLVEAEPDLLAERGVALADVVAARPGAAGCRAGSGGSC